MRLWAVWCIQAPKLWHQSGKSNCRPRTIFEHQRSWHQCLSLYITWCKRIWFVRDIASIFPSRFPFGGCLENNTKHSYCSHPRVICSIKLSSSWRSLLVRTWIKWVLACLSCLSFSISQARVWSLRGGRELLAMLAMPINVHTWSCQRLHREWRFWHCETHIDHQTFYKIHVCPLHGPFVLWLEWPTI